MRLTVLIIIYLGLLNASWSQINHYYRVSINPTITRLNVHACLGRPHPLGIEATGSESERAAAQRLLIGVRVQKGIAYRQSKGEIRLRNAPTGTCIDYQVNLTHLTEDDRDLHFEYGGPEKLLSPSAWLWLPIGYQATDQLFIEFNTPKSVSVSVPWPKKTRRGKSVYLHNYNSRQWSALTVFGRFYHAHIKLGKRQLHVAILGDQTLRKKQQLRRWIHTTALAIKTLFGQLPMPDTQIVLVPVGHQSEPVPFGEVVRGGAPAVILYIDPHRPIHEFLSDWTSTHELSHLFLPYVERNDAWLSEGLATYYQNVLRVRAHQMSEREAWQELYEGFERGIKGTRGKTLREATRYMHRNHAYMRVYWSGTAILLKADLALRRQSRGKKSLDWVLQGLNHCCMQAGVIWSGRELMAKMDRISHTTIFSNLYQHDVFSTHFPSLKHTYEALGITVNKGQIQLKHHTTYTAIRQSIMAPHRRAQAYSLREIKNTCAVK